MTVSWSHVILVDIFGSAWVLILALCCVVVARKRTREKPDDTFRHYVFLLTIAIVFFAISRSFGHLAKQILLMNDMENVWHAMSPYCGASNTVTFIVIFAFGLYFQRFQRVHLQIEDYQNSLEEMVSLRTEELKKTNSTLENVLNASNPLCITDIDHKIIMANHGYWDIWSGADDSNIRCYDSRPCDVCKTDKCPLQRVIAGAEEVIQEVEKTANGAVKVFIVTARPFWDASGKLLGVVESFQDISRRKVAERALDAEKEQLAVTLRSIGDGVITTDLEGKIVLINRVTEQLTGWSMQEAVGQSIERVFRIVDEQTGEWCKNPITEVLATGLSVELESSTALISKDNSRYSIEDSGAPIFNLEGTILGAVLVFRDVTEKRRAKEELFKVEKLESVGLLAGGIAHDFNNILAAVLGNIEMAGMLVGPDSEASPLLDMAKKASLRAKDLTQQLLTFSKGGNPVKKTTSIGKTIRDATDFILHGSALSCDFVLPDSLWLVDIDPGQIAQVIQNLVINAKAVMPDGGKLTISGENVLVDSHEKPGWMEENNKYIRIIVEDEGSGIAEEALDNIFDPYFTTKEEGSGLGLAVTHSIIQNHHGHIEVQSQLGVGTTFCIYLPASVNDTVERRLPGIFLGESESATVIIMDDEKPVREIAMLMLEKLGHVALEAKNGEELIAIFKERQNANPIDVILMDLTVPGGMGGKEAMQEILALDPDARAIVSSGYSNDPVMADYTKYGFKAAVTKPFLLEDLQHAIMDVMSG